MYWKMYVADRAKVTTAIGAPSKRDARGQKSQRETSVFVRVYDICHRENTDVMRMRPVHVRDNGLNNQV